MSATSNATHPLQVLTADIVDSFSGSTELLTVLNHLGLTTSKDSLERSKMTQTRAVIGSGIARDFTPSAFRIASVDNIDKNSPFAAVYAGQERRGFHGTSIQVVESPSPVSCQH